MRKKFLTFCTSCVLAFQTVQATVGVSIFPSTGGNSASATYDSFTMKWNVDCTVANASSFATITITTSANNTDNIDQINVHFATAQQARMTVGTTSNRLKNIDYVFADNSSSDGALVIDNYWCAGNAQSINAHSIVSAFIGGNLVNQIQTHTTGVIGQSSIDGVQIVGDCLGDVYCAGSIRSIIVTGNIGSTSTRSNITVATHIYTLKASNIYADIVADTAGTFVSNIETTKTTTPKGTFVGSLTAADFNADATAPQRFYIRGDLDADITLASGIKDKNSTDPEFQVDGKFKAGRTIRLNGYDATNTVMKFTDPLGLEGQVIINGDDNHPASPLWRGTIQVDGVTLSPKNEYTQTGVGGGAIGFAPFHLYDEDCDPANNLTTPNSILQTQFTPTTGVTLKPIKVRFYGPVAANPAVPDVVRVIHNVGGMEFDVTHRCDISVSGRTVTIAAKSGTYFVPTDDSSFVSYYSVQNFTVGTSDSAPLCDDVTGSPEVPAFEYRFELGSDCEPDGMLDSVKNS